jgi:hypothetical protein
MKAYAEFGECEVLFFAVDIVRRIGRPGFFKSQAQNRTVTYLGSAASKLMFDAFNEPDLPPTDEVLTRQFECLSRATGAEQISQSAVVGAEQWRA